MVPLPPPGSATGVSFAHKKENCTYIEDDKELMAQNFAAAISSMRPIL